MGTITGLAHMTPEQLKKHRRKIKGTAYDKPKKKSGDDSLSGIARFIPELIGGKVVKIKQKYKTKLEDRKKK